MVVTSRVDYSISNLWAVGFNDVERRRFEYVRAVLGMDERQALGFLVRCALTWFPSVWLQSFERINELRDDTQGIDWADHDDIPF